MNHPRHWAVVPAAGSGSRMKMQLPKQYLRLVGRRVIEHTLEILLRHPWIEGAVVVTHSHDIWWEQVQVNTAKPLLRVNGGNERCDSVLNGLRVLSELASSDDWVLVHDAARPCLRAQDLERLMTTLRNDPVGGLLAVPVSDTIKRADARGRVRATEDRRELWHALTPQMFRFEALLTAMCSAREQGLQVTDEASAMEAAGLSPRLVEGRADNIKITRPEDLALAEFYLPQ